MTPRVERVFEQSHIRRGRLATSPTWFVEVPGWRYRFMRKKDALAFVASGAECPEHASFCSKCNGVRWAMHEKGTDGS